MIARNAGHIFLAVQKALFLRELGMRITTSKTGLFWTFFEPFMQIMVFVGAHSILSKSSNREYAIFIAVNFVGFNLFRNIMNKSMGAFSANKALFIYKQVKPIDTIISRMLVELYMSGIVIILFLLVAYFLNMNIEIKNLPMVTLGYLWISFFGMSIGLLLAVGNIFYPSIGRLMGITSYFLLFGSAVFYSLSSIPPKIREILLYNPVTHFMELIHGSFFYDLDDRFVDYNYMFIWTVASLFVGIMLYRYFEKRIISI